MDNFNIIGIIFAGLWVFSGFWVTWYMENRASRGRIPEALFPYLTLLALFLGPLMFLVFSILDIGSGTLFARLKAAAQERRDRCDITIYDARGQETGADSAGNGDSGAAFREAKKILYAALQKHASDVFIDPRNNGEQVVRLRVDGALQELCEIMPPLSDNVVNVIKVAASMDIAEKRRPQDGSFSVKSDIGSASLRVASVGAFGGEKLSIRLLGASSRALSLNEIGLAGRDMTCMRNAVRLPSGMVLVCGPTGSGKTTTLYALLKTIDYRMKNVISIEDPIEQVIENVSQMEVNSKADISFAKLLRNALRQNPDIICLGEIRDEETAQVAVHAAQTGHLIIATVHSNDNVGTIDRIVNLGVPLRSVAGVLQMIVSQRLVRRLCDCAEPDAPSPELAEYLTQAGLPTDKLRKPCGCKKCGGTGYRGRMAIFDIMVMNNHLREVFEEEHATIGKIKIEIENTYGGSIMAYEGYKLAAAGITSVEEVERVTFDMEHSF